MTTRPCPECGVHVSVDARECPDCGHVIAKTVSVTAIVLLVLVLGAVVMTVLLFAGADLPTVDLGF